MTFRYPLVYGIIGGAIVVILSGVAFAFYGDKPPTSPLIGYLIMVLALTMIFVGTKRFRDVERGGVIRFLPAFGMGLAIALVAAIIYVIAWEIFFVSTGGTFIEAYMQAYADEMQAAGASQAEIAAMNAEMEAFAISYANPLVRIPLTFLEIAPVGLIVAFVSAVILRDPRVLPARRAA